jgi:predicted  nucleic acid-binding Zn-ribbon protein
VGRVKEIRTLLDSDVSLGQAQELVSRLEDRLRSLQAASREGERELAAQRAKIEEVEKRIADGSVRPPKEWQDLQLDSEAMARHLHALEDDLLQTMMQTEEAEAELDRARVHSQEVARAHARTSGGLEAEQKQLESRLSSLSSEREAAAADVLASDLALYNDLRRQLGGVAVSPLRDDACGICGLALPASMGQVVRQAGVLVRCSQCGRILYAG